MSRARALTALLLAVVCAALAAGCGDTLQDKPIPHNILEGMVVAPFPVYWLGNSFGKLKITEATHDPGGAFSVQYGNCLQGGQGTCTPPLKIVTSPDNSFLPGGETARTTVNVRGIASVFTEAGRTIAIPTGGVVVDVFANDAASALAAARAIVPINQPGAPGQTLPARRPDTGFGSTPLPSQLPATVRPLG
ncbi:MAG TPA: hypothetical protein VH061_01130 [Solirubrobacteraceae bacterium]|jgi:hypothetical protein|nr:hypothetical protein [Solirubrobacteraceae bacterium]